MVAATNVGAHDKPFSSRVSVRTFMSRASFGTGVSAPPIPDEAKPFLQYLPMLANFIQSNRRPTRGELSLLRAFAPDAFRRLKALSYEEIVTLTSPFEADPSFAVYVRLVKSEQGRGWLTDVIAQIQSM